MSDSAEELARNFIDWIEECWPVTAKSLPTHLLHHRLSREIGSFISEARSEAFEECAKISEGLAAQYQGRIENLPENSYKIHYRLHSKYACEEVSQAIRQQSQKGRDK